MGCCTDQLQVLTHDMPEKKGPGPLQTLLTIFHCLALQLGFSCSHVGVKPGRTGIVEWEQPCGPRSKLPSVIRAASDVQQLTLQSDEYHGFISAAVSPVTDGSAVIDCKPMHHPEHATLVDPATPWHRMEGTFLWLSESQPLKGFHRLFQGSFQWLLGC